MTPINLWKDTVVYDELTINQRHKSDTQFSSMLDEIRRGSPSESTIETLKGRVINCPVIDISTQLHESGYSPDYLFPTRKAFEEFNSQMLKALMSQRVDLACKDEFDETSTRQRWNKRAAQDLERRVTSGMGFPRAISSIRVECGGCDVVCTMDMTDLVGGAVPY